MASAITSMSGVALAGIAACGVVALASVQSKVGVAHVPAIPTSDAFAFPAGVGITGTANGPAVTAGASVTLTGAGVVSTANVPTVSITYPTAGHEPGGFTPLCNSPFTTRPPVGWDWYGSTQPTLASDVTAPISQPTVGRITYATGFTGGSGQGQYCFFPNVGQLYISAWIKLSSGFEGHPTSANKVFYISCNGSNTFVVFEAYGAGAGTLQPRFVLQNLSDVYQDQGGAYATTVGRLQNVSSGVVVARGDWVRYEFLLTMNTPGYADGIVQAWQNDVETFNLTGITFLAGGPPTTVWESICWQPIWGGVGGVVGTTFTMDCDHVILSGL